jgi:transposase
LKLVYERARRLGSMSKRKKVTRRPALHAVKVNSAQGPEASTESGSASAGVVMRAVPPPEPATSATSPAAVPDPEVTERAARRVYSAEFKRQVLQEVDGCTEMGEIGAVLRRHGLYSSHLKTWREQRERGELAGLAPRKRGRKAAAKNPLAEEVARLERELRRMTARAERAEGLVDLQKKMAALLGEEIPSEEELFEAKRKGLPIPPWRKKR